MKIRSITVLFALFAAFGLLVSCDSGGGPEPGFAAGAFPPTLSDTEEHKNSWTREDCLICHESGVVGAPKLEHKSLPPVAKEAKCRTCHVFVAGSEPSKQ